MLCLLQEGVGGLASDCYQSGETEVSSAQPPFCPSWLGPHFERAGQIASDASRLFPSFVRNKVDINFKVP